jgi:Wiskott-Aldrich syndrome protein
MTGHAGTVPSSPAPIEARTPDPEPAPPQDSTSAFASSSVGGAPEPTTIEDIEGVPHPRYPLPTKPFQVQPPPKITTGYATTTPLDRTKGKPRHWRPAHREIRGIAGGRWFARTWVGEKDSELAIATEAALSLPRLPALSISAPASGARTPGKRKPKATDANSTAASSRSASAAPEGTAPAPPLQRSTAKKSALSTAVAASEVEMEIDPVS